MSKSKRFFSALLAMLICVNIIVPVMETPVYAAAEGREFAVHITWVETGDPDTYVKAYNSSGAQVGTTVNYGHKAEAGITLDKDDTEGANSACENETTHVGSKGGEWITLDFDALQTAGVEKVNLEVQVHIPTANITATVVDKKTGTIVTKSYGTYTGTGAVAQIGFLVKNGAYWDFVNSKGDIFSGGAKVASLKMNMAGGLNIPDAAQLKLVATYPSENKDTRTWTKAQLSAFLGSYNTYYAIEQKDMNVKVYWVVDGVDIEIASKDIVNGTDAEINITSDPPSCECTMDIVGAANISENIDLSTAYTIDLAMLEVYGDYKSNGCFKHTTEATKKVATKFTVVGTPEGCTASISNGKLTVDNINKTASIKIKATAEYNTTSASKEFDITLERNIGAPIVKSATYDSTNQQMVITIEPNGQKSADVFIDGAKATTVNFDKATGFGGQYLSKTITQEFTDIKSPGAPMAIQVARDTSDKTKAKIAWTNTGDADNLIEVYAASDGNKSSAVNVNVKDIAVKTRVYVVNAGVGLNKEVGVTTELTIGTLISEIPWDSSVTLQAEDSSGNKSSIKTLAIPNSVIYTTRTNDDSVLINEGMSGVIDAKANDEHDPLYPMPDIVSVEILDGKPGIANILDASQIKDGVEGMVGLIISFASADGTFGDIKLKYTYAKVRDDVPAVYGNATVHINQRNQEPIAVNDNETVTAAIGAESDTPFSIPTSMLLANDTDRETPESLTVSAVRNCSSGTVTLNGNSINVVVSKGYYGYLTFDYRVADEGGAISNNWATVTVYVKLIPKPPVAQDVETQMQLSDKSRIISMLVDDNSGVGYALKGDLKVYRNGMTLATSVMTASAIYGDADESGLIKQYIQVNLKDTTGVLEGDVVEVPYTVTNKYGTSSATIRITITKGSDINDMEGYLYVHRRPIALFRPTIIQDSTKTYVIGVSISSPQEISYDLDHQVTHALGREGRKTYSIRGIRAWEWGVKTLEGNWTSRVFDAESYGDSAEAARQAGLNWINSNAQSTISNNYKTSVVLSLRVRDIDGENERGVWSEPRTILLASMSIKPVALFTLDKSTYLVPTSWSDPNNTLIKVTDMSYDANGDPIGTWTWELTDPNGTKIHSDSLYSSRDPKYTDDKISRDVSTKIMDTVNRGSYNPKNPTFKLSLVVKEGTSGALESDKYSVSFEVYKENKAPVVVEKPGADTSSLTSSTLYQVDNGADGTVGDDWGKAGNANGHKGVVNFPGLFNITDDQPVSNITLSYLFEGQKVFKRTDFLDSVSAYVQKSYSNLRYSPFQAPFSNTVTDQGFLPGAYRLLVTAKDNPSGGAYAPGSSQTTYYQTQSNRRPYHFYVVPKLDMFMHSRFNGWIDQTYREEDGKTLAEAGLTLEDIVPTIGDTIEVYGTTNQFINNLWGYEDYNNNSKFDAGEKKFLFVRKDANLDGTQNWVAEFTIEDIDDAPVGSDFTDLRLVMFGETIWGSETGAVTRTKQVKLPQKVMPVKLFDFRVTGVTDPDISDKFDTYVRGLNGFRLSNGKAMDGVPVGKLAVDKDTTRNAGGNGSLIRKGYSFYFSIGSKGLAKDSDYIGIVPKFYSTNTVGGVVNIGDELVGYLPDEQGKYTEYTTDIAGARMSEMYALYYEGERIHSLGSHANVKIPVSLRTVSGSEQLWVARYGIPADAKFFKMGSTFSSPNEYTGEILVTFNIKAYKNNKARYDYVQRGQWLKERSVISDALKTVYKAKEADWKANNNFLGTIIVYNGAKSVRDDYISNPVWNE